MCRILAVTAADPFPLAEHLQPFALVARLSREYQGHGWGCAWWDGAGWQTHHAVTPIWEESLARFDTPARVMLAHARSAFRDEGIVVENNMPFLHGGSAFVFNGELRGVRIAEQGRIGAEKLFRFLLRQRADAGADAVRSAMRLVGQRTRYLRAANFVIGGGGRFLVSSSFGEDPQYFTLHTVRSERLSVVCSVPYDMPHRGPWGRDWLPLGNGAIEEMPWFS